MWCGKPPAARVGDAQVAVAHDPLFSFEIILVEFVGAVVVGMLLTPPDLCSQTMLAIPVWILFEAGLYVSKMIKPRESEDPSDISDDELEAELERAAAEIDDDSSH